MRLERLSVFSVIFSVSSLDYHVFVVLFVMNSVCLILIYTYSFYKDRNNALFSKKPYKATSKPTQEIKLVDRNASFVQGRNRKDLAISEFSNDPRRQGQ